MYYCRLVQGFTLMRISCYKSLFASTIHLYRNYKTRATYIKLLFIQNQSVVIHSAPSTVSMKNGKTFY